MNVFSLYCFRFFVGLGAFVLLFACAPQQEGSTGTETKPKAPQSAEPSESVEVAEPSIETDAADEVPDWEKRYQELYAEHAEKFRGPEIGDEVNVERKDGGQLSGRVYQITDNEIVLDTGTGFSTFRLEDLSETSAMTHLKSVYAQKKAYDHGKKEYEEWESANSKAAQRVSRSIRASEPALQPAREPDPEHAESNHPSEFPFTVESNGRVPHVEKYIRKNAAFPESLRVRTWWPVKPHERGGYQVRVRYTLKSAGNLGTSYEDMIFFMYANGRIHQRAPVK